MSMLDLFKNTRTLVCAALFVTSAAAFADDDVFVGDEPEMPSNRVFIPSPGLSCGAGISDALFIDPFNPLYRTLAVNQSTLTSLIANVNSSSNYNLLLSLANSIASSRANGRVIITIPNGTVMIDTAQGASNTFTNFLTNMVNPNNLNTSIPIANALTYPCGIGLQTAFDTTSSTFDVAVSLRLGSFLGIEGPNYGVITFVTSNNPS